MCCSLRLFRHTCLSLKIANNLVQNQPKTSWDTLIKQIYHMNKHGVKTDARSHFEIYKTCFVFLMNVLLTKEPNVWDLYSNKKNIQQKKQSLTRFLYMRASMQKPGSGWDMTNLVLKHFHLFHITNASLLEVDVGFWLTAAIKEKWVT